MKLSIQALVVLLALSLGACTNGAGNKEIGGTLLGAGLGGLLGSQFGGGTGQLVATGAGVFLGGLLGNQIGQSLDRSDTLFAERSVQQSLESNRAGQSSTWTNPDSRNAGTITPTRTFQLADGQFCREFQQTVTVGGRTESAFGTACRRPDGTWQVVN